MNHDSVQCPFCKGEKSVVKFGRYSQGMDRCPTCNGSGLISPEYAARIESGKAMRLERQARGESLYDAAEKAGMTPAELSRIEGGRTTP